MQTRTLAFLASAALAAAPAFAQGEDRSDWPTSFTVGTASHGGTFFVYGAGWANLVAEVLGIAGEAEVTGGPMQNMALVHSGQLAFGLTTLGPAAQSLAGQNPIAPGLPMDKACAMFPMYQTPFSLAALSSSGITSISEIPAGARIGFGPVGSTADTYFPAMLEALGVSFDRHNAGWDDLGGQLQDGRIDVIGFAAGVPIPAVSQLEEQVEINLVGFTDEERETLVQNFPVSPFIIPAGTHHSLEQDANSVAMWTFAIANCDLPESFVYEATRITMEENERMVDIHESASESRSENWEQNNVLQWHPGAARWFNENGAAISAGLIYGG